MPNRSKQKKIVGDLKLTLSPLISEDLPEIFAIEQTLISSWTRRQFEEEIEQPSGCQYVARSDSLKRILAYICCRNVGDEAEILKLAVAEVFRRQGVGKDLLLFTLEKLQSKGVKSCFLELRASNVAARKLYEKMAFQVVGKRKAYYSSPKREGAILMVRKL